MQLTTEQLNQIVRECQQEGTHRPQYQMMYSMGPHGARFSKAKLCNGCGVYSNATRPVPADRIANVN